MALLTNIGVGAAPNDGTGDTVRAAFQKINTNNGQFVTSASDPTVNSDTTGGFVAGAYWFNTATGFAFRALSVTTGAAVWLRQGQADHPGYFVGNWYQPYPSGTYAAGAAVAQSVAKFIPFIPVQSVTISNMGIRCTTLGTSNIQFGVYNNQMKASFGACPGTEIAHSASVANTGTGMLAQSISASLTGGTLYWLGCNCNDATMVAEVLTAASGTYGTWLRGSPTSSFAIGTTVGVVYLSTALTFGTWGDLTGNTFTEGTNAAWELIEFQVASVP